jgi:phosphopantothenoylcysteine synthetase/decarboxylase
MEGREMKTVLITSGGTKIAIDKVRSITNMSNGTLGTKMAKTYLEMGYRVIFFRSEASKSPMTAKIDLMEGTLASNATTFNNMLLFWKEHRNYFTEVTYKSFDDYQSGLQKMISFFNPDTIILAAAVSDYAPKTVVDGKIRSKGDLNIELEPLPKVISKVREWAGKNTFIVGFKLLVGASLEELESAAIESKINNKLDMVCANDLTSILSGNHTLRVLNNSLFNDIVADNLGRYIIAKNSEKI